MGAGVFEESAAFVDVAGDLFFGRAVVGCIVGRCLTYLEGLDQQPVVARVGVRVAVVQDLTLSSRLLRYSELISGSDSLSNSRPSLF